MSIVCGIVVHKIYDDSIGVIRLVFWGYKKGVQLPAMMRVVLKF